MKFYTNESVTLVVERRRPVPFPLREKHNKELDTPKCTIGMASIGRRFGYGRLVRGRNRGNDAVFTDAVFIDCFKLYFYCNKKVF